MAKAFRDPNGALRYAVLENLPGLVLAPFSVSDSGELIVPIHTRRRSGTMTNATTKTNKKYDKAAKAAVKADTRRMKKIARVQKQIAKIQDKAAKKIQKLESKIEKIEGRVPAKKTTPAKPKK